MDQNSEFQDIPNGDYDYNKIYAEESEIQFRHSNKSNPEDIEDVKYSHEMDPNSVANHSHRSDNYAAFEEVRFSTPKEELSRLNKNESDDDNLYDDEGNIIHLHQLPESLLKLRDCDDSDSSSSSGSSVKVAISQLEHTPSRTVIDHAKKLRAHFSHRESGHLYTPSDNFDVNLRKVNRTIQTNIPSGSNGAHEDSDKMNEIQSTVHEDNDKRRDEYVRSATRFRSLLDEAFRRTALGCTMTGSVEEGLDEVSTTADSDMNQNREKKKRKFRFSVADKAERSKPSRRHRLSLMVNGSSDDGNKNEAIVNESGKVALALLKEKTAEILTLQRALKESQEHANAISHANATLREASATTAIRMERTTEALRIAGLNAANARADADASEARAAALASQLSGMKTVLEDTKRSCEIIRADHEAMSVASKDLERKYLQIQAELSKMQHEKQKIEVELKEGKDRFERIKNSRNTVQEALDQKTDEICKLQKAIIERDNIERVRLDRTHRIELELRESRTLLIEATAAVSESESTTNLLNETINELKKENRSLHEHIASLEEKFLKDQTRLQEQLSQAESECQKLRLKNVSNEEDIERLHLGKSDNENEISCLKRQIADLERRLAESNRTSETKGPTVQSDLDAIQKLPTGGRMSMGHNNSSIPPLKSPSSKIALSIFDKENFSNNVRKNRRVTLGEMNISSSVCCICFKASFGVMKYCQCGRQNCEKRAHASCLVQVNPLPSVSHPGTPAPALPTVLCNHGKD